MSTGTPTPNFGLHQWAGGPPGVGDAISRDELNENFADIDSLARAVECTSVTRPSSPFPGMLIAETDTGKALVRNNANTAWLVITGITIATNTAAVSSPTAGQIVHESNTRLTYFRDASAGAWRMIGGIPIVNSTSDITAPTNGQLVWSFTGFGLFVWKSSTSTWTPVSHDQYYTYRLGTNTTIGTSWVSVPFATAGEGSNAGISTSDNITWTLNEAGIWSVRASFANTAAISLGGALFRGTVADPFNATNSEIYSTSFGGLTGGGSGVTMSADIRVATGGTRTVRCSALGSGAGALSSSGPSRPRISFNWSPL
jgi:hypothetical protein